ncbi:Hypothetical protein MIP_06572 [Mycobacterium intracellulare subsp. intracellulare MTCC 9506]|uniref:Uncharacterized protein n=1 Tax=Mycobacterium indicus pranii (strain DSM 45239 / MTCC 9506) TaxID=1232724 RepID=J9WGR5_MYCIP|nr:Hypothetical protein MIP_06572 [Mycobacterium intracellulare subsp. intracellulare MTCC 9506]
MISAGARATSSTFDDHERHCQSGRNGGEDGVPVICWMSL